MSSTAIASLATRLMPITISVIALFVPYPSGGSTIMVHSGNGTIGSIDSLITMLVGPAEVPFSTAFTSTEFAAARSGPGVPITGQDSGLWKLTLDSDPTAKWIRNSADATALYAIDFVLTSSMLATVSLDFDFLIDNQLGDNINEGLFVNEFSVVGSKLLGAVAAYFGEDQSFPTFNITPFVVEGTNTLYVNAVDLGGAGAVQFSAAITAVPEPSTFLLFASGLAGLVARRQSDLA